MTETLYGICSGARARCFLAAAADGELLPAFRDAESKSAFPARVIPFVAVRDDALGRGQVYTYRFTFSMQVWPAREFCVYHCAVNY